jgi:hypothetical protein
MDKIGSTYILAFMLAVVFFFLGLALASPLTEITKENLGNMNCSDTSIDYQTKTGCVVIDMFAPLFVATLFGLGGFVLGRFAI